MKMMIAAERSTPLPDSVVHGKGWRTVVAGSGGAGKTTLAALLALCAVQQGEHVLAVDADEEGSLAYRLGVPVDRARSLIPLSENVPYLEEKTGLGAGPTGEPILSPEPDVNDVIERWGLPARDRLKLLFLGNAGMPPSGCPSSEYALMAAVWKVLGQPRREVVVIDFGGSRFPQELSGPMITHALILAEPRFDSLRIAEQATMKLLERGVPHLFLVVNGIRSEWDVGKVKEYASGLSCYGHVFSLPFDESIWRSDPDVSGLIEEGTEYMDTIWKIYRTIAETII